MSTANPRLSAFIFLRQSYVAGVSRMRVRVYRGAYEIAGICIEIESSGARIVLTPGRPLHAAPGEAVPLPDVAGARDQDCILQPFGQVWISFDITHDGAWF